MYVNFKKDDALCVYYLIKILTINTIIIIIFIIIVSTCYADFHWYLCPSVIMKPELPLILVSEREQCE